MHKKTLFSKDFILVAAGQIISVFGNQIVRFALPLYLLNQTGSSALFGTILAISFLPMILFFPIGGIIADRVNKRNVMVILDFCTAILILLFYLLTEQIDIIPLMAVTMIILCGIQGVYMPAVKASIPVLVKPAHMMKANSVVDMINSVSSLAGPVMGGFLFSVFGLTPILYVSITCFFSAAIMEIFIHIPFEKRPTSENIFTTGWGDLKESFHFMFGEQPILWKVSLVFSVSNLLLTSLIIIALPVLITQRLEFEPDKANRLYGYSQGVIAAGAVLGGLLAGVLSNKLKSKISPSLLIGCSLSVIICGIALQILNGSMEIYIVLLIGCCLLLILNTLFQIQMMTYLQLLTPTQLLGKVISCFMCVVLCTSPLGQLIYGFVYENIHRTYLPFYFAGATMIAISLFTRSFFYSIDHEIEEKKNSFSTTANPR